MAELDIAAFLRARYDEREAVALAAQGATEGRWEQDDPVHAHGLIVDDYGDTVTYDEGAPSEAQAVHIADNDPAFVLADVAAKRQIIELHVGGHECREIHTGTYSADWPADAPYGAPGAEWRHACSEYVEADSICETLRLLAQPHAGHPDFREEWKP